MPNNVDALVDQTDDTATQESGVDLLEHLFHAPVVRAAAFPST